MTAILSGYRVIDLTDAKGMLCARLLADMGADVIVVETPGETEDRDSGVFRFLNAGKRSVVLDVEESGGREVFKKLIATADVLVETSPPGRLDTLDIGYGDLSRANPGLIMASITGFGQAGPYCQYTVSDLAVAALGGQLCSSGDRDTPPLKIYGSQAYYTAGLFAANGIMLALWHRHATGRGQHLDISMMECVAAALDHVLVRYWYEGAAAGRGNRQAGFHVLPCLDGYILVPLHENWETLVEWLASEGMADDLTEDRWRDRQARLDGVGHIVAVLEQWTKCHRPAELVEKAQLMRLPWAGVTSIAGLLATPQLAERRFFVDLEDGAKCPGPPFRMGRTPWRTGGHVPAKGEHTAEILGELGLTGEASAWLH